MERRLAAVLIADVVGYGRHSRADEEDTRTRFNHDLHHIIGPMIARHSGRLVKTMGDGVLVEFKSVVDALRCAIEWQTKKAETIALRMEPDPLVFRIGINLGDIISEPPDIHGDGVNLAARVQALAQPGGIALTGAAYDQVQSRVPAEFKFIGSRSLKSIPDRVRVYQVGFRGHSATRTPPKRVSLWTVASIASCLVLAGLLAWLWSEKTPAPPPTGGTASIIVLPFDDISDGQQQGHLADGITEDLTTELAQVPGLFVISRSAAFAFREKGTPQDAANKLGVRYVMEGSVRRAGEDLRITAQLIDAKTNGHLWANRYDVTWNDVFAVQDKIVGEIAQSLKIKLSAIDRAAKMPGGTLNPMAYDSYLRGRALLKSSVSDDWRAAIDAYEKALGLDPEFGAAAAELAWVYHDALGSRLSELGIEPPVARKKEVDLLEQAAQKPSAAYYQLISDRLVGAQRSDDAISAAQAAIDLDPSDPLNCHAMAYALILNGQPARALQFIERASKLDPTWNAWRHFLKGFALFSLERYTDSVKDLEIARLSEEDFDAWSRYLGGQVLLSVYGNIDGENASDLRSELDRSSAEEGANNFSRLLALTDFPFKKSEDRDRFLKGLANENVPELPFGLDPKSPLRLHSDAIRSAFFGHELVGTQLETGESARRLTSADGKASVTVGLWHGEGTSQIEGDAICSWFPESPRNCYTVFLERNARPGVDGFLYVRPSARFLFTPVK
jgi:TolB-like protein/class 3 adenylate cyclase